MKRGETERKMGKRSDGRDKRGSHKLGTKLDFTSIPNLFLPFFFCFFLPSFAHLFIPCLLTADSSTITYIYIKKGNCLIYQAKFFLEYYVWRLIGLKMILFVQCCKLNINFWNVCNFATKCKCCVYIYFAKNLINFFLLKMTSFKYVGNVFTWHVRRAQ